MMIVIKGRRGRRYGVRKIRLKEIFRIRKPAGPVPMIILFLFFVFEHVFKGNAEYPGDPECKGQRGDVLPLFQSDDGLPRALGAVSQFLLGHLSMFEALPSDMIEDVILGHCRPSLSPE